MKIKVANLSEFVGISILVWITSIILLTSILLAFNIPVSKWNSIIPSVLLLITGLKIAWDHRNNEIYWFGLFSFIIFIMGSLILTGWFYDISWDGMDYHQKAVISLINGFNPVYQTAEPLDIYYNVWLNHYPKASWFFGASLYALTGNIETGKAINLLMILSSFFILISVGLRRKELPWGFSLVLAFLISFNPVSIYQSLSFYVDGLVSSSIVLLIGFMISITQQFDRMKLLGLFSIVLLGLNIKFTGLAYFSILGIALFISYWVWSKNTENTKKVFGTFLIGVLFAFLIVGFNPYITNVVRYGNPFFPVYGSEDFSKEYIMGGAGLPGFIEQNAIKKMLISTFSKTSNSLIYDRSYLKIPFHIQSEELSSLSSTDIRLGGFGPWFSGALVLSSIGWLLAIFLHFRKTAIATGFMLLIVGSMLTSSEFWWARYAPQFWLIPITVCTLLLIINRRSARLLGWMIAFVLVMNTAMTITSYYTKNITSTVEIKTTLRQMHETGQQYQVFFGPFSPWRIRFEEYHIPYREVRAQDMKAPSPLEGILYESLD